MCARFLVATAAVVIMLTSIPANAQKSDVALIEKRAVELTEWIVKNSTFKFASPPPIIFVPQATITRIVEGNNTVRAMYFPRLMVLRDDFELGVDDKFLLHELVHHLQFVSGKLKYEKDMCTVPFEVEAYGFQNKFVRETGGEEVMSGFQLMLVVGSCNTSE